MLKIEKTVTASPEQWEIIIEGMRNPKNSWDRMDSFICKEEYGLTNEEIDAKCGRCPKYPSACDVCDIDPHFILGEKDHKLMDTLNEGGPVHAKYRRMIPVWVTINAPLYWWKEFDTYKVGTVCNSCSTMHKIHAKRFTIDDFSHEHLIKTAYENLEQTIKVLNGYRSFYLENNDKEMWWQMIQLLPTSYNQKRTILLNYEVLVNIYKWRRNHKLDEWHTFCDWIEQLPYSELITMTTDKVELSPITEPRPVDVPNGIVWTKEEITNGSAQA